MKKTQKKIVGAFGLSLVVGMTIFAATLPGPEASAINTVTDHLNVRVIEEGAEVKIVSPASGSVFSGPNQEIVVDYANVDEATITITRKADRPKRSEGTEECCFYPNVSTACSWAASTPWWPWGTAWCMASSAC